MHLSNICLQFTDRIIQFILTNDITLFPNSELFIFNYPNTIYINKNLNSSYTILQNGLSMIKDYTPSNRIVTIKYQPQSPSLSADDQVYMIPIYNDINFKLYENKFPVKHIFFDSTTLVLDYNYESTFLYLFLSF